ncbi:MAG: methyltransferase, partial [Deltaproteobacteria bacterium]|nr:methyltransferase [Deltaproteobacteria bacterium]
MQFEITIEGPALVVSEVGRRLEIPSLKMEKIPSRKVEEEERGRIAIQEGDEDRLDDMLLRISRVMTEVEEASPQRAKPEIRVRNLAYSEPYAGSSQFSEPFNPVPMMTIHPWSLTMPEITDPRTIILDPGHAFGTGKHPSTRLCLMIIESLSKDDSPAHGFGKWEVLDFGCGTGLLAIAALKLGANRALGVEIDLASAKAAKANAALNHLSQKISVRQGSWEVVHETYDLILANLVISALLRTAKHIPGHLKEQGKAVV